MNSRIAQRYALALMGIGKTKGTVAAFASDMKVIEEALHGSAELRSMLHSPVIRPDIKRKVLTELFKSHVGSDTLHFMDLLVKKGRGQVLADVAIEFQRLLDADNNTVTAEITSATELSDSAKQTLIQKLQEYVKMTIRPSFRIDSSLRGGFVAKVGDTLIDASLQHQLDNLREEWKRSALMRSN